MILKVMSDLSFTFDPPSMSLDLHIITSMSFVSKPKNPCLDSQANTIILRSLHPLIILEFKMAWILKIIKQESQER